MATLLSIAQDFCRRQGLAVPSSVYGSTDPQVLQIMALMQEGLEDLSARGAWERLINEATWSTLAAESQGTVASLATNGFRYLLPETLWNRTSKLPLLGPLDPADWQLLKAVVVTGPQYSFRIRGGLFRVTPAPPASETWAFEYVSKNFLLAVDGTTYLAAFTADTNEILLPEQVVIRDLRWRWKKEKGLPYQEDFNACEALIADSLGRDGGKKVLHMDDNFGYPRPGIYIPAGSWISP